MTAQKFAICNETFAPLNAPDPWRWERTCAFLAKTGYDGVELAPFTFASDIRDVSASQRAEIKRIAADSGLEIVGLHWLLVSPPGLHLHTTDGVLRQKTLDYLKALVDFAGDVGAPVLVLGSPKARTIENGDEAGAWQRMAETLAALTESLTACHAVLCPEALPGPEADFLLTQADAWKMVAAVNHPAIRMMLDVKSMCSEGPDAPAALCHEFGARTVHVHANDSNRRGPGFGDTDFKPLAVALKETRFSGYVSVEVFDYSPDPETIARESLRYLRECWGSKEKDL
ncbi:sugar phosphate isomerase/epimerase family protein [Armatimonas sp.]|uniref:sugar phosphate isomerase/epimerase family protein n=1 Tax=Armatimonas sp. TaxID=1872638 RepID=UPI0037514A84